MSNISSYLNGRNQYLYKIILNSSDLQSQNSSLAGCGSGASAIDNGSGASGASGASNISGSDNSYKICSVSDLKINEITDLFTHGNLTVQELEKWINAHKYGIKNESKSVSNGIIRYQFTYGNKDYNISCSEKAAAEQTDNLTQKTYLKSALNGFNEDQINKYFVIAEKYGNYVEKYALRPDCGFNDIVELKNFLKEEAEKAVSTDNQNINCGRELKLFEEKLETDEFDKEVTYEEAKAGIKQMTDLMKTDLKEKYNFSDDFLDAVSEFAISDSKTEEGQKYNLKTLLNSIKKI